MTYEVLPSKRTVIGLPFGIDTTVVNSSTSVTTASTLVMASNSSRNYALITNDSDTLLYLGIGAAAKANQGARLASGGTYQIDPNNRFVGSIYAISSVSGKNVITVEG